MSEKYKMKMWINISFKGLSAIFLTESLFVLLFRVLNTKSIIGAVFGIIMFLFFCIISFEYLELSDSSLLVKNLFWKKMINIHSIKRIYRSKKYSFIWCIEYSEQKLGILKETKIFEINNMESIIAKLMTRNESIVLEK